PGQLSRGGRLQMLTVKDRPEYDTRTGQTMGAERSVAWVDIDDPDPSNASQDAMAVFR
ncbi:MAG TPA: phosphatase, partial [Candidatus Latescibacteria bacterium]|nr:phosphatase [Candidatus Latescibacterota bacterium]